MKQITHFLMLFSIVCLLGLLTCGTVLAAGHEYKINDGNITIKLNETNTGINITYGSTPVTISDIPLTQEITIFGDGSETTNIVVVDGKNTDPAPQINITVRNVNINGTLQGKSAFALQNKANVKLILTGTENVLNDGINGGAGQTGLNVPDNCLIKIVDSTENHTYNSNQSNPNESELSVLSMIWITACWILIAVLVGGRIIWKHEKKKKNKN